MIPHGRDKAAQFLEMVLSLEREIEGRLSLPPFDVDEATIDSRLSSGVPLLNLEEVSIDLAEEVFLRLLKIGTEMGEGLSEKIRLARDRGEFNFQEMVKKFLRGEMPAQGDEALFIRFLLTMSLRPELKLRTQRLRKAVEDKEWLKGCCPVCGFGPSIALISDEDGSRYLCCSLCDARWNYPRVQCPFCQNQDHNKLGYFTVEGEERYRVDLCHLCGGYIKTVICQSPREVSSEVEDLASIHLDILAKEYISGGIPAI